MKIKPAIVFAMLVMAIVLTGKLLAPERQLTNTKRANNSELREAENKVFPDEQFFFARTYPDFTLNLQTYTKTIEKACQQENLTAKDNNGLNTPWTLQGPGNIGGRINTIAVNPDNPDVIYAGCAKGGVFKTSDGGENWIPVFDDQPFLPIGHIALDPTNPDVVYVGTGDENISISFATGNGLYKSTDAGLTWTNIGLAEGRIISSICINPQNPDEIYVGCMGNPMERDQNRGLYKTTNGGASWEKILYIDDDAGIIDMVMNPQNPNVLYAASWNRIRNNQESIVTGEDAKIWKTTNGGNSWEVMTNGLPTGELNRIGLDIYPTNPEVVVASVVDVNSQLLNIYRTDNAGELWYPIATPDLIAADPLGSFGWYFGKVNINPWNDQEIYLLGVDLWRTTNNGTEWLPATPEWWLYDVHADKHCLWFVDPNTLLLATDGGMYKTTDGADTWTDLENIPNTQFYRIAFNPHLPGYYTGGAQDNGTTSGNYTAVNDWIRIYGADGFQPVYHPTDPNIFYVETQFGNIAATTDGGINFQGADDGVDPADRTNWDSPYIMSAFNPDVLYRGTYRIYKNSSGPFALWEPVSPDLTDGVIFGDRFHTISCLAESPLNPNFLYAGTSDGNVWRSTDAGLNWQNINSNLPDRYVTALQGSPGNEQTVFVTISGYKGNGDLPHVFRSDNNGNTWQSISGNLPQVGVNDILILPDVPADSGLVVATDIGVYVTLNNGLQWQRAGTNMPFVTVYDIALDPVNRLIIAGTFARSMMTFPVDSLFAQPPNPPVGIAQTALSESAALQVYPNPVAAGKPVFVTLPTGLPANTGSLLRVINTKGQVLWQQSLNDAGNTPVNVPTMQLQAGLYLLQLTDGKTAYHAKLVVQR
ncbi:T9SS C-terminal target domain-containing protein [Sphingobacteriales bacterium UPWRP_1]|nr:hypothetical protein BVG80_01910 [Sphingobacteriales bacterium TSM_CSM]PSJ75114.1 T9SS C-terminal target domain-containing protein [Sphingobacteriales bacterium UPWRP_1]